MAEHKDGMAFSMITNTPGAAVLIPDASLHDEHVTFTKHIATYSIALHTLDSTTEDSLRVCLLLLRPRRPRRRSHWIFAVREAEGLLFSYGGLEPPVLARPP